MLATPPLEDLRADLERAVRPIPDFPKPGILFQDILPIFGDAALVRRAADALAAPFLTEAVTHVVGVEARGFLLGPMVAQALGARFVPARKAGKLPGETHALTYALEYGEDTLEVQRGALGHDAHVLVHDDVLATGGTARAARSLAEQTGASVAGFAFLAEIAALDGREALGQSDLLYVLLSL